MSYVDAVRPAKLEISLNSLYVACLGRAIPSCDIFK